MSWLEAFHAACDCVFLLDLPPDAEQEELLDAFASVEHNDMGPGTHEKYLAIAAELAERFGVECRASSAASGEGCCGHH